MMFKRSSGILLHPTSLPGKYGIGTLGVEAREWIDFLSTSAQTLWQILPLGPVGLGNSPYQCFSAFAGNALLIDLEALKAMELLDEDDLHISETFDPHRVRYDAVIEHKTALLKQAFENFDPENAADWERFESDNAFWLDEYALFMALREHFGNVSWLQWDTRVRLRDEQTLEGYRRRLKKLIDYEKFVQYLFFKQYTALKAYANDKGIRIVGDIPIYVSLESADVWSHQHLFLLEPDGSPTYVAGVPPDYFSTTGQRWGNPIFDWEAMQKEGFSWWLKRLQSAFELYDYTRIDHFRGFEAYWSIPSNENTAIKGTWIKGPGKAFFDALSEHFDTLPIIAEDLGVITPEVEALRDAYALPGMKILQFAFDSDAGNGYLPHNVIKNCIYYTGTHDNNTVLGWFYGEEGTHKLKQHAMEYLKAEEHSIHWDFIRAVFGSVADVAIVPLQDVLGFGGDTRMNTPGTAFGNWEWRYESYMLSSELQQRLLHVTQLYGRQSAVEPKVENNAASDEKEVQ